MRALTTRLVVLVATVVAGCSDGTRTTHQPTLTLPKNEVVQANPRSVSVEGGEQGSLSVEPSIALLGTWEFDPEAMRKTSEFKQQIELLESRGSSRQEANQRTESAFAKMSALRHVFTKQTISLGKDDQVLSFSYHIVSEADDTVVIETTRLKEADIYTTVRIVDIDHLVISDDSRPDVPVWTFKRVSE
jgi:hypothetical protein